MTEAALDFAALTDAGTSRTLNEDACGSYSAGESHALVAVADGVSGFEAGEVASRMAVEVVLRAYREEPASLPAGERLYRAFQQANIEIHDRAMVVPELRGMATTLTTAVVDGGDLTVVHVGDSRLYLIRGPDIVQLTKDHTVVADRVRLGLLTREKARTHPDRSILTRSMGRELIVTRDRIRQRLRQGDLLVLCSDGLHGVLEETEIAGIAARREAEAVCRELVAAANARGTPDNLTVAAVRVVGPVAQAAPEGVGARLRKILGL